MSPPDRRPRSLSELMRRTRRRRALYRRSQQLAQNLKVPAAASLETVCAVLATQRQRGIELVPVTTAEPPWSFILSTATRDYLCYPYPTSRFHQQQHSARQLGHLLLADEQPEPGVSDGADDLDLGRLLDKLHPRIIQRLAATGLRVHLPDPEETEAADYFGYLLLIRLHRPPDSLPTGIDDPAIAAVRALEEVLTGRP